MASRIRALLIWAGACFLALAPSTVARADSWLFRPSYFSHAHEDGPVAGAPRQFGPAAPRIAYHGGPYFTPPVGAYARGGWRHLHSVIHTGSSSDVLHYHESFIQFGEQF